METDLLEYVLGRLEASRGRWPAISAATGVPYDTITKIAQRKIVDPRYSKLKTLADHFRESEERAA